MPPIRAISRKDLIRYMKKLGFDGPLSGGKHAYMERGTHRVRIPNPHQGDISKPLLLEILRQADITHEAWEVL